MEIEGLSMTENYSATNIVTHDVVVYNYNGKGAWVSQQPSVKPTSTVVKFPSVVKSSSKCEVLL